MASDTTTFFLAFTAVFLGIAVLLWRLERQARHLEDRVEALEALDAPPGGPGTGRDPPAAKPKSDDEETGPEP